jgi:two-component system CheB/CheR fusion protein
VVAVECESDSNLLISTRAAYNFGRIDVTLNQKPTKRLKPRRQHETAPRDNRSSLPIVGIGASAGGLEACTALFRHLALNTGAAFVLVQHLDPTHESVLPELLSRTTKMPVLSVQDRMRVESNHIYVIPPNTSMTVANGVLSLQPREDTAGRYRPIDRFLESLAQDQGHRAIGVILSGTATDGTVGLSVIKAEGGITFAQNESAKFESMPRSAVAAGSVDFVLSPEEIAREIARILRRIDFRMPPVRPRATKQPPEISYDDGFADILRILRKSTDVDFAHYKPTTVERRIVRRMILNKQTDLKQYRQFIEATPGEVEALYQDLLISVTGFFRNPEVFEALKARVFPEILRHRDNDETVRVWVYGCSTGEEAYSIAMAFVEFCRGRNIDVPLQIFATDVNETAIERARTGLYPKAITDVSPETLRRFFTEVDGRYQINKTIRDMCVFARQNLITDPPFSHMDLVSCRNVLIYLDTVIQRKIIPMFHYALKGHGLLMLGASESVGTFTDLFEPADHKHKIYRKKAAAPRFDFGKLPVDRVAAEQPPSQRMPTKVDVADGDTYAQREADRILLSSYRPAAVLINKDMEILQYRGAVGTYLEPTSGKATHNLLKMARTGLLLPLRKVIQEAIRTGKSVQTPPLKDFRDMKTLRVKVVPVRTAKQGAYFLVIFLAKGDPATSESGKVDVAVADRSPKSARTREARLEEELIATKEYLQSIIDQQQAYVEELQSSNEEVQSSNEELQSLNEEMETAKEETQATNEELNTLNDEMQSRNRELHQISDDLINLFQSVRMPVLMVDREQRLRRFTPAAEKMFHLKDIDLGHPIPDLKLPVDSSEIAKLLEDSIERDRLSEKEIQDNRGCWFVLQVGPYKTANDKTAGAMILLKDIDAIRQTEIQVRASRDYAEAIIATIRQPMLVLTGQLRVKTANRAFYEFFGVSPKETENKYIYELGNRQWDIPKLRRLLQEVLPERTQVLDFEVSHMFPTIGPKIMILNATRLLERDAHSQLILLAIEDVTALRRTQDERAAAAEKEKVARAEVEAANQVKDEFLATLSHELRTPLNSIFGWATLLNQGKLDSNQTVRGIQAIMRNAQAQVKLVDDLMEIARIISGKLTLQFQFIDAAAIVSSALETVRPIAESKHIELKSSSSPTPLPVQADPDRLQQVLWNLLSNAIKFTPVGGRIHVSSKHSDSQVEIAISDNGQGIKPDFLPHVFQRFTQADSSTTRAHGGLGLGLAIARQLIELHGGSIKASSAGEGRGATFTIQLPYRAEMTDRFGAADAEPVLPIPEGLRVLVVDDESEARELLSLMFEQRGAKVRAVASSAEALQLLKSWRPEVLIADIGMPDMDGYQLIRQIRALPKNNGRQIPAVAVTAYASEGDRQRALEAGYHSHIAKPFPPERLMAAVARLVGEHRHGASKSKPPLR